MAALKKKEDDMRAMEERYKMYLEKARNVSEKTFFFFFFSSFKNGLTHSRTSLLFLLVGHPSTGS